MRTNLKISLTPAMMHKITSTVHQDIINMCTLAREESVTSSDWARDGVRGQQTPASLPHFADFSFSHPFQTTKKAVTRTRLTVAFEMPSPPSFGPNRTACKRCRLHKRKCNRVQPSCSLCSRYIYVYSYFTPDLSPRLFI